MIREEEVFRIGVINRPHGLKGEVVFTFTDDVFVDSECDYLVLLLDGIFVPFFIEEYRFKSGSSALVKFEDVDTAEKARRLTNVEVYFPVRYAEGRMEDSDSWSILEGFRVIDKHHGDLGRLTAVDDSTANVLFVISKDGEEVLLPALGGFVLDVDRTGRVMYVDIPDGLLDRPKPGS